MLSSEDAAENEGRLDRMNRMDRIGNENTKLDGRSSKAERNPKSESCEKGWGDVFRFQKAAKKTKMGQDEQDGQDTK